MSNIRLIIILCKVIIILGVFAFGLLFLVQNIEALRHEFVLSLDLFGTGVEWKPVQKVPYYYPLIGSFAFGGLFATAFFFLDRISNSIRMRRLRGDDKKSIQVLEGEINRLRNENKTLNVEKETKVLATAAEITDVKNALDK